MYYLLANWCFLYLIQERHFTVLEGGWLAATPPLAAAIGARRRRLSGGPVRRALRRTQRTAHHPAAVVAGRRTAAVPGGRCRERLHGRRRSGGVLLLRRDERGALLGRDHARRARRQHGRHRGSSTPAAISAVSIATPIIAYLSGHNGWTSVFLIGTVFALISAAAWLLVDPSAANLPRGSAATGVTAKAPAPRRPRAHHRASRSPSRGHG